MLSLTVTLWIDSINSITSFEVLKNNTDQIPKIIGIAEHLWPRPKDVVLRIESIHGFVPDYFTIVLEVTGFDRASTNAEIKFFHEVQEDYYQKYHYPTFKNQ